MNLVMPRFQLARGKIICLHIPHGFNGAGEVLESELLQLAKRQGKTAVVSAPAQVGFGANGPLLEQTSAEWLSVTAGVSIEESEQIIIGLGERVADKLAYNAGTPRCLLGLAAALISKPDVVAYSTLGCDVQGKWTVHRFVASRCIGMCLVHISHPSVFGDGSPHPRTCPPGAQCFTLTGDSANAGNG
jgi:hypothetical protein